MILQCLSGVPSIRSSHTFPPQPQLPLPSPFISINGLIGVGGLSFRSRRNWRMTHSACDSDGPNLEKKRKVIDHICLLKAKRELSDDEEKEMLDYLYTTQYQMRGILAISLGRISGNNYENYTHAVFMRFQRKEDVAMFYENPFYLGVLKEHVLPYCHEPINVDYETEVEDDILPIFRKGEDFNYGVEFMHLIAFKESAFGSPVEDALASLATLTTEFPSLVVQTTQGSNFNFSSFEYTHGVVTRFRSMEAFDMFVGSTEYKDVWGSKFGLITRKHLPLYYIVDSVGTEIM